MADFEDSSAGATEVHTPTLHGAGGFLPTIDNVVYKYGGGSGLFDGIHSTYVTFPDSVDFECGTQDFTFSGWFWLAAEDNRAYYFGHETDVNNRLTILIRSSQIQLYANRSGTAVVNIRKTGLTATTGWHHIEIGRNQDVSGYIFIDGVKVVTLTTNIYAGNMPTPTGEFNVGRYPTAGTYSSGNKDVIKFDKGICRHNADFTPPVNEDVDNDAYTVLLLKMNPSGTTYNISASDSIPLADLLSKTTNINLPKPKYMCWNEELQVWQECETPYL